MSDDLVDLSDILPTFVELASASLPPVSLPGASFAPRLLGKTSAQSPGRTWVFAEGGKRSWVRDRRWKLYADGQLFDVAADPEEKRAHGPLDPPVEARRARARLEAAQRSLSR